MDQFADRRTDGPENPPADLDPGLRALLAPALGPRFARPSRLGVGSAWHGHVPFARWIVGAARPGVIVELGTHAGISYAALCDAVLAGGLDARCYAVDTWQGDEHAGFYDEAVFTEWRAFHDARYGGFSRLLRCTFDAALSYVADSSVDLLHIDGRHRYEDVAHDFAAWRPKLSRRAVVLFHDTNVRERDFGVWRFWAEISAQHPSFEFLHAYGLGVLAFGAAAPEAVQALCRTQGTAGLIRERFALLGERWALLQEMAETRAQSVPRGEADALRGQVDELWRERERMIADRRQLALLVADAHPAPPPQAAPPATSPALPPPAVTPPARRFSEARRLSRGALRRLGLHRPAPASVPVPAPDPRPRILFISGEASTPGHHYRVLRAMAAAEAVGWRAEWSETAPVGPHTLAGARVVVLWRVSWSAHVQGIIESCGHSGATLLFDVDDLMFKPELARIEVIDGIRSGGHTERGTWTFFELIRRALDACAICVCPTEELANQIRDIGRTAFVLPNGFDEASHARARRGARAKRIGDQDGLVRIGYAAGSRTHQRDFAVAVGAVARVLRERTHARLTLFRDPNGGEGVVLLNEFPALAGLEAQIEWRNMVPIEELPDELSRFDINVAPLETGNEFCEAKSELKYFEAALADVPTVASPTGPMRRAIRDGETGFLADTEDQWHDAIIALVDDATRRRQVGRTAYHDVLWRYGPARREELMLGLLRQVEGGREGARAFELELRRQAEPRLALPTVPECEELFAADTLGAAEVTVIIPVYNYEGPVIEALESVRLQTLEPLDLVVIDDGSTDDSAGLVLEWARRHAGRFNRLIVRRHRANAGLGFARNSGFAAAETPFVLPLDADNRLRPACCATLLERLRAGRAAFAYPALQQFGDKSEVFNDAPYSPGRLVTGNYIDAMALIAKWAWAAAGGYDHVRFGWEDYDFWCRLAELGLWGEQVPEILAEYRVHRASMLASSTDKHGNKRQLIADMHRRHPWLRIAHPG